MLLTRYKVAYNTYIYAITDKALSLIIKILVMRFPISAVR